MGEAKHTPGPWTYERGERFHAHLWVVTAAGMAADTPLARLQDFDEAAEPDARLIAAAPDLLEALKAARPAVEHLASTIEAWKPALDQINRAIAAVEGRNNG